MQHCGLISINIRTVYIQAVLLLARVLLLLVVLVLQSYIVIQMFCTLLKRVITGGEYHLWFITTETQLQKKILCGL